MALLASSAIKLQKMDQTSNTRMAVYKLTFDGTAVSAKIFPGKGYVRAIGNYRSMKASTSGFLFKIAGTAPTSGELGYIQFMT